MGEGCAGDDDEDNELVPQIVQKVVLPHVSKVRANPRPSAHRLATVSCLAEVARSRTDVPILPLDLLAADAAGVLGPAPPRAQPRGTEAAGRYAHLHGAGQQGVSGHLPGAALVLAAT